MGVRLLFELIYATIMLLTEGDGLLYDHSL